MLGKTLWWATVILLLSSGLFPHDRLTWLLEIVWIPIGLALLAWYRPRLTGLLTIALFVHAVVLIVGAYYTYERVPLGTWVSAWGGWERNHYDRLGHFCQGFIPAILVREWFFRQRVEIPNRFLQHLVIIFAVQGFSSIFELIEWLAAILLGGGAAAYLGSQGDPWDAQADMACALLGATLATTLLGPYQARRLQLVADANNPPASPPTRS